MPPVTLNAGILNHGIPPRHPEVPANVDSKDKTDLGDRSCEQHVASPSEGAEDAGQKQVENSIQEEPSKAQPTEAKSDLHPNENNDLDGSQGKNNPPREKSLMETLMEDFDPDLEILPDPKAVSYSQDANQGPSENNGVASDQAQGIKASPDTDKDDMVARVPSLSGWMPSQQSPIKNQSNMEPTSIETKQEPDADMNNDQTDN
jgi:hypothetical protein